MTEIAGDILFERRRAVGDAAAERRGPPAGAEKIGETEEREAFWKRFLSPEQEQSLLAEGRPRHAVAAAVYPRRWEVWESKGELPDRLRWAERMAKLGPPEPTPEPGGSLLENQSEQEEERPPGAAGAGLLGGGY